MDIDQLIDEVMKRATESGWIPGGVTLAWHKGELLHRSAHGMMQTEPEPRPAQISTIYDLASLTKPIITTTLIMQLVEQGILSLEDPVSIHIPEFKGGGKDEISVRHLLLHTSGLSAFDRELVRDISDRDSVRDILCHRQVLAASPGSRFIYSDLGPILLGLILEEITGQSLDEMALCNILAPLDMVDTGYCPGISLLERIAPTERVSGELIVGEVHDPVARKIGGVAGHAGLFGTADDLLKFALMICGGGIWNGVRILSEMSTKRTLYPDTVPGGWRRATGWDVDTVYSSPRGDILGVEGVGHTGYTGTSLWICPERDLVIILLTNRVHPIVREGIVQLRRRVTNVVVSKLL